MEPLEIDEYYHLKSPIHSWDPRAKIVSIMALIFSIVLIYDLRLVLLGLVIAIALLLSSRIPLKFVIWHLRWVFIFILPFLVVMPLAITGGGITFTYEGFEYALLVSTKALTSVILIFPMIGTMRFDSTTKALEKLKIPNKIVQMITFTYRYIFVFIKEFSDISRSIDSRGFKRRTNMHTIKTLGTAVGMLFVKSFERSERVYIAMQSRGYTGTLKSFDEFEMMKMDWVKSFIITGAAIGLHLVTLAGVI
ncbi:MAG: cobalt ECF transporter T component CbiQ [Halobacteriota archaeon]|nr:cobalt ECF transporter T component CbiQ [Halobacteriota archaeon]MDY6960052.1 cobalt ECF transporter T component CbiQ [Halobacteriota archaeon]